MIFNITALYDKIVTMVDNKRRLAKEQGTTGVIVFSLDNLGDLTNFAIDSIVVALSDITVHKHYRFTEHEEVTINGQRSFRVRYELL